MGLRRWLVDDERLRELLVQDGRSFAVLLGCRDGDDGRRWVRAALGLNFVGGMYLKCPILLEEHRGVSLWMLGSWPSVHDGDVGRSSWRYCSCSGGGLRLIHVGNEIERRKGRGMSVGSLRRQSCLVVGGE